MSFIDVLRNRPQDERLVAEENKIYRIGFNIFVVGILLDLLYSFVDVQVNLMETGSANVFNYVSPIEFLTLMTACIVCAILQTRKGFTTSNKRFADTDSFPAAYYVPISLGAGLGSAVVLGIFRSIVEYQVIGFGAIHWAGNFAAGAVFGFLVFCFCLLAFMLEFRSAKKQREKELRRLEEGE